ncbi:uncharacterized protein LOC134290676 [Aedes albopictus]|uniref:Integrase catalytic domain-containing protein n=1 Tax=Aedes albopictus TaxID=7160 RepID=A0ABM1ZUU7_AEDAL
MMEVTGEELAAEDNDIPQYFLPHHAILRPDSTTTKLRIVFDASCKSGSGPSLNDILMTGPTIQDTLNDIVLRFRLPPLHCGPQPLLAVIRQQFWPLGGRNLARDVVHKCVTCVKVRPGNLVQLMGSLPAVRVIQSYAFENVGVDFAGPFYLQRPSPRVAPKKSYVAVFVCMATKATHLELVNELTTAAFIGCLRRFVARRGRPHNIYCDNATNFVGAGREVRNLFRSSQHRHSVAHEAASQSIQFHFILAKSPNFGGLWEACVISMKHHLRRVIGNAFLPREAFCTVLAQVESCLNSRLITPLSSDPNDMQALTPGRFLIGRALCALPDSDYITIPENHLRLWERVQRHIQHFWKRWHREYLTTFQQRYKWLCILPVEVDPAKFSSASTGPTSVPANSTGSTDDLGHLSASAGAAGPIRDVVLSEDED